MFKLVGFMQKRFRGRFIAKSTKAILIDDLWFTLLSQIREKAQEVDSDVAQRMLDVCMAINEVPDEIRKYVLLKYQEQMQKLSWIYFYHQRRIERPEQCDNEEISLQIFKLQSWLKDDLKNSKDKCLLTDETHLLSEISDDDLRHFDLLESIESLSKGKNSLINSFHEIGWIDPFPKITVSQLKKGKWNKKGKKAKAK